MKNDFLTSEIRYRTRTSVLQGRQHHIGKGFSDLELIGLERFGNHPEETQNNRQVKSGRLFHLFSFLTGIILHRQECLFYPARIMHRFLQRGIENAVLTRRAGAPACGSGTAGVLYGTSRRPRGTRLRVGQRSQGGWFRCHSKKFMHNAG